MNTLSTLLAAPLLAACGTVAPTPVGPPPPAPQLYSNHRGDMGERDTALPPLHTWDVVDPGTQGQYPAIVVHFSADWEEDTAGVVCDTRGGTMIDDRAERFVCIVD